jgi:transposase
MADASASDSSDSPNGQAAVRCKPVERNQLLLRTVDVEKLVGPSHAMRAIWELVGHLDLKPYCAGIAAVQGEAGRPVWDPRVLISLWIYAYKDGISSAREIERRCQYHPAYQWLTGMEVVNYHTLADFFTAHEAALERLFIEVLGVLSHQGLITLRRVMHDGTKIKAAASDKSFHRQATLEQHLKQAAEQVKAMGDPHAEKLSRRRAKAKERALREKQERLRQALTELEQLKGRRAQSQADKDKTDKKTQLRVSSTDPEARVMLGAKGAYGPAYNVQISTDSQAKIIVGVGVTQCSSDAGELPAAVERIEQNLNQKPEQMVVDAAYPTSDTIDAMAAQSIDLIGPLPQRKKASWDVLKRNGVSADFYPPAFCYDPSTDRYQCPAGKLLRFETEERACGWIKRRYRAQRSDCRSCPYQAQCCPKTKKGRSIVHMQKTAQWLAFEAKMHTDQDQQIYKQRAGVAEFPNAWIKQKMGLRQFRLRGRLKVRMEVLWACLAYNICQWIRLCWSPQQLSPA